MDLRGLEMRTFGGFFCVGGKERGLCGVGSGGGSDSGDLGRDGGG